MIELTLRYPEEAHARELHRRLAARLANDPRVTSCTVDGGGVHWQCKALAGERAVIVRCFDVRQPPTPQYLSDFREGGQTAATGRTRDASSTVDAAAHWLGGTALDRLHARHAFVDANRRALTFLVEDVIRCRPGLAVNASHEIRHVTSDIYRLLFSHGDRSCEIYRYGEDREHRGEFHWDGFFLFEIRGMDKTERLAAVMDRWLCQRVMPSAIAAEFPEARLSPAAPEHEAGQPIEGEFAKSWQYIEEFYRKLEWPMSEQVLAFLHQLREAGYERVLRTGQSMFTLVLSRAKHHGLRGGQSSVVFCFLPSGMDVTARIKGQERKIHCDRVELTPDVQAALGELLSVPIA